MAEQAEMFRAALLYCLERGGWSSQEALAAAAGVSQGTISDLKVGRYQGRIKLQERVARACGYDLVDFLSLGRGLLTEKEGDGKNEPTPMGPLDGPTRPVVIFDANCGNGVIWTDGGKPVGEALSSIDLPLGWLNENSFVLRVHNKSMEPTLNEGDLVLVDPRAKVNANDIVFVSLEDGDKVIKRYRPAGDAVILESDNRDFEPIILDESNGKGAWMFKVVRLVDRRL